MMYAGSKLTIVNKIGFTKVSSISSWLFLSVHLSIQVFEFRSVEELTEEALIKKLKFF